MQLAAALFPEAEWPLQGRWRGNRRAAVITERILADRDGQTRTFAGAPGGALLQWKTIEGAAGKLRFLWRRAVEPNHLDAEFVKLPERLAGLYDAIRLLRVAAVALAAKGSKR
jgi:hypothetical protein